MDKKCGVYKITCLSTNMIYIGSSIDIYKRWGNHRWALKHNVHNNKYLQRAWNKYGEDNFVFEIIELCKAENQFVLEQKYLDEFKPFAKFKNGYNILEDATDQRNKSRIEFVDYDDFGYPHKIRERNCSLEMPITSEDCLHKSMRELQNDYDEYVAMLDLYEDMVICDPDYE